MSYVSTIPATGLAGGDIQSRAAVRNRRPTSPRSIDTMSVTGWLQVGLVIATLSSVSFVMSIVAAGAF